MVFRSSSFYFTNITNMKIVVINGSPKGDYSITLHTCLFLQNQYPQHQWKHLNVGKTIHQLEKDFTPALEAIQPADLLLFCYPVYTFMVPSQLHRFIELMKQYATEGKLNLHGKWTSQISTSKHFYDLTAHRFIEENAQDLELRVLPGLSADMEDILTEKGRKEASQFFEFKIFEMQQSTNRDSFYKERTKFKVAIVADLLPEDETLNQMVNRFCERFPYSYKIINIRKFPFKGGCISCFNCSTDGQCIYTDRFDNFLRQEIQTCDAIVYAFSIQDHSMGSRFKIYDDRQFCNGHRTVTMGAPTGYLVNGDYLSESNLQMVLEGRANVGGNYLCGVALNDGTEEPIHRTMSVEKMADTLAYALSKGYKQPANFLGVGGMKIFRDLIYQMRGMMRADHKFFKSHQQYDFPQKQWRMSLKMYLVGWLMGNKTIKSKMGNKMNEGMIKPYKEAIKKN